MSDIAIRAENLGKMYQIGSIQQRKDNFRDVIVDAVSAPVRRARSLLRGQAYGAAELDQTIWALKDLSFEIKHGEVIGIIGRNGAGKSTLLKILSRITEPSAGYVDVYGRVGALLEVGTGFHQELTGRENVYLNGAILGMGSKEIDKKFDEIVDFAGVEKFIDTPVKHYSSGMRLRLGFAVAAHLEPEILVVDEVLAVGDIAFQKKCLGTMENIASEGRTVLFVSHNMAAVENLTNDAILLEDGFLKNRGRTSDIIAEYSAAFEAIASEFSSSSQSLVNHQLSHLIQQVTVKQDDTNVSNVGMGTRVTFEVKVVSEEPLRDPLLFIGIHDSSMSRIATLGSRYVGCANLPDEIVDGTFHCVIDTLYLASGKYFLSLFLHDGFRNEIDRVEQACQFEVVPEDVFGSGELPNLGVVYMPHRFQFIQE